MRKVPQFTEARACVPCPVDPQSFNPSCSLPYGLAVEQVHQAMDDFIDFLCFINRQLHRKGFPRLETFFMPANFSSIVGEFMNIMIPKHCPNLVQNKYHNGHPDLLPRGVFPGDAAQYATEGIEVKGSRRSGGWQGHNPESVWLMVFHFVGNTSRDRMAGLAPQPFLFKGVYAARLGKGDWNFSGRTGRSRRTITASVNQAGVLRMRENWVYQV